MCWFPRSCLSSWRSWDSSNMTWALGYWVAMPIEFFIIPFSNEHGISDSGGFSSERTVMAGKMLWLSHSSPRLGSKQHCREAAAILVHFSMQLFHACVCTFIPWCNSPKLQLGGTSTGQIPAVTSDTHSVAGIWCFPCFPLVLSKGSRPGHPASWLGFCLGKVVLTMGTLGLCLMWQQGETCAGSQGAVSFGAMKAALFPSRSCCLSSLWLEVAPCVWWRELCAPAGLFASPASHALSYTWALEKGPSFLVAKTSNYTSPLLKMGHCVLSWQITQLK